jgi:hypothetical protein
MDYLQPQFPAVPQGKPHYESVYLTATHPTDGRAFWIRYTVRKPPGQAPVGSIWFTEFKPDGPRAAKVNDQVTSAPGRPVVVGEHGSVSREGATGSIATPGLTARWDLSFTGDEAPLAHLPFAWMYGAPFPRTKPTSPRPDVLVSGTVEINGETTVLDGWRGMLGHNWGSEHAHEWIWLRGAGFTESPSTWLDVVIGRIRLGPVTVPWIANGVLSLAGERQVLGGLGRRPDVRPRPDGLDLTLPGRGRSVVVAVDAPLARCVGWEYADPAGSIHHVRNCSNAGLRLELGDDTLTTTYGGIYELGTLEGDPGLVIQPFPDR